MPNPSENPYAAPQTPPVQPPVASWPPAGANQSAPCFRCGSTYARKVDFTWWGGLLGPKMLNHVRCVQCGQAFNAKTGRSNLAAIVLYQAIVLVVIAILFFAFKFV